MKYFFYKIFLLLLIFVSLSINSNAWWDINYEYRINLTIDHTKVDSQLTNFPVLVKLDSLNFNFADARSDGYDLRFLDSNNNLLNFERVRHDSSNEVAEYWVNITTITSTDATNFYLYYGNPEADDVSSSENVWDDDYVGVFHMNDATSSSISDSSSRGNDGTKSGTNQPQQAEGIVGYAQEFSPTTEYIQISTDGVVASGGTYSVWFNLNILTGRYRFIGHVSPTTAWSNRLFLGYDNEGSDLNYLYIGLGDTWNLDVDIMRPTTNTWYHMVLAFSDGDYKVFVDGNELTSGTYAGLAEISSLIDIGNTGRTDAERVYSPDGFIDEVRISRIQRSDAWIVASFHSENNSLLNYGDIEELPVPFFTEHNIEPLTYLNPGSTKTILCNGTVNHENGFSSITEINGSIYHESFSANHPLNRTYLYNDSDCTTIDTQLNGWFECSFEVYFFAMPGDWICGVRAIDDVGLSSTSNVTTFVEEMIAIGVDITQIDFGIQVPGTNTGTNDFVNEIYNQGNVPLDINVRAYDENPESSLAMDCTVGEIPVSNLRFDIQENTHVESKIPMQSQGIDIGINFNQQTSAISSFPTIFRIYWGAIIPNNVAGTCNGYIRYTAFKAE